MEISKETPKEVIGQLTEQELTQLQNSNNERIRIKIHIGDLELQKQNTIKRYDELVYESKVFEQKIIKKHGENSVVNIQTGEVTSGN